jgi:broad specificity phosphatase PhoE
MELPLPKRSIFIWIRHGDKEYHNNKGPTGAPQHDPPIIPTTFSKIVERGKHLMRMYGPPLKCICSPYLRCRQTASLLLNDMNAEILIDTNISEFLGFQKRGTCPDLLESTWKASKGSIGGPIPPCGEKRSELDERIHKHLTIMNIDRYIGGTYNPCELKDGVYWIVTHGIVIEDIFKELTAKPYITSSIGELHDPEPLDALLLDDDAHLNLI